MNPMPGDRVKVKGESTVVVVHSVVHMRGHEPYIRGYAEDHKVRGVSGAFRTIAEHRIERVLPKKNA